MSEKLDCIVIGGGAVGLAIGRTLAVSGREVVVVEAEDRVGVHASSRNSEVIHAGIYYEKGTLKARLCARGRHLLYRFCEDFNINHQKIGKLIVATQESDLEKLQVIDANGRINGVEDLIFLDGQTVQSLEPNVACVGALLSPSTGIFDSHEYLAALRAEIEAHNGAVVLNSAVAVFALAADGFELRVDGEAIGCRTLINAAGFGAQGVARASDIHYQQSIPDRVLAKGHYFSYQGKSPFEHLIYPLPSGGGLGIHATNDLAGTARFGPDVTWIDDVDYTFDESRKPFFVAAIRQYFPALDEDKLMPAYTGIRSKIVGPGQPAGDFVIQSEADHGVANLVNLFGIESPGLTASLAIGEEVRRLLRGE